MVKVLVKLIDAGYVPSAWPEVEKDLAFVVRGRLVSTFNFGQESTPSKYMNPNKTDNEKDGDDQVCTTTKAVDKPQPAACENNKVKSDE